MTSQRQRVPRIGLVTNNDFNRRLLQKELLAAGYPVSLPLNSAKIAQALSSATLQQALESEVDAWLLDLSDNDNGMFQILGELAEQSDLALLFSDTIPDGDDQQQWAVWRRRLLAKLELLSVTTEPLAESQLSAGGQWAETVWVLAASMGGPKAVTEFLNALPAKLPMALVYGQHIQANFDQFLVDTLAKNQPYPVHLLAGEHTLTAGQLAVVPVDRQLRFLSRGRVVATRSSWHGQYQPALDQVIAELARQYRHKLGVIIFSGLCDDGAIGCRVAKACGATVWAQSPASSSSSSMPQAAIDTGCVSLQGTPQQLAASLAQHSRSAAGH